MALIVFSHANSYVASTYRVMFDALRALGHTVEAIEHYGSDPCYPVTDSWPYCRAQLAEFAGQMLLRHGQVPVLVGHSMGGALSAWVASSHPHLASSVIVLDSFIFWGWQSWGLWLVKKTGQAYRHPPASIALKRRYVWDSPQQMYAHLRKRGNYKNWDEQVFNDFLHYGTVRTEEGAVTLRFKRELEAKIYATFPHGLMRQLKHSPLQCPYHYIGGLQSKEIARMGLVGIEHLIAQRPGNRLLRVEGSHLFPMERPQDTARWISELL